MMNTKLIKLEPNQAIALSERQFKNANFNIPLYRHSENEFFVAIPLIKTLLPFAEVKVLTVEPERIFASVEEEAKPIVEALKRNKAFIRVFKKGNYPLGRLIWKYSFSIDEYEEIKRIKYPVFYVILNNGNQTIAI